MNISYNWLRELTELELPPGELRERLTLCGLEVEAVHEAGGDFVLELAIPSNRADLLSHLGVAREVGVITGRPARVPEARPARTEGRAEAFTAVEILDPDLCPRYAARVVRGVRVGLSPDWLARRLQAIGQRPINNVADVTNYVMHELGQPLHAFDLAKLAERRIVVRRAAEGETLKTLDGVERRLDAEMLVIADAVRPVALAGVMGGAESEISDATTEVLLESAYFEPSSVRRTSRLLGLQTDASERFERGTDYEGVLRAQARAAALVVELAGGVASEDALDVCPRAPERTVVRLRLRRVRGLTGLDVPPHESLRILSALGFAPESEAKAASTYAVGGDEPGPGAARPSQEAVSLIAPSWRTDVKLEEDLIEEIGRHFGYETVDEALPPSNLAGEHRAHEERLRAARRSLAAVGFDEAISFSFIDAADDDRFALLPTLFPAGGAGRRFVTLTNPIIEGAARMRPTLLPGLLAAVRHNFNHNVRDVRLFELGRVFAAGEEVGARPQEREALALALTGGAVEEGRAAAPRELDFYDLKGALEAALDEMKVPAPSFAAADAGGGARHLREGQAALISLDGRPVGTAGRLSDELSGAYKFRQPVYVAELDLAALLEAPEVPVRYTSLPRFPSVVRDSTFVADRRVSFAELRQAALGLGVEACRRVELVYVYEGEKVPEGRRSITLRFEYRADERTLRDEEVDAMHARIVEELTRRFGGG